MHKPYWMQFANLGLIRLNQSASDDGGGSGSSDDDTDDVNEEDDADVESADGDATEDDGEGDEPRLETIEDYQAALQKAEADRDAVRRERRKLDRQAKKDARTIAALKAADKTSAGAGGDGDEFDADAERDRIRAEVAVENGHEKARLKAEALLTGKVNIKPAKAVVLLGDEYKDAVGDDGSVDEEAIADLVEALLEDNPGLKVARGDGAFQGSGDGGVRDARRQSEEQQITEQIEKAKNEGKFEAVIALKQRLAAIQKTKKKG